MAKFERFFEFTEEYCMLNNEMQWLIKQPQKNIFSERICVFECIIQYP